ncbi:energy-dependent translational throttle protein EttA [Calycomorphotria hydatis]|uniref:Energy-dependent translational throttle protein EttA n=1 Tax=Calycomorphotria hydatis TaxID=2528027 RepID=A0A517T835_9PLAN|nr:energy-dependent translational throttle protein EttA [Calycomorphotria hydatis]QDT64531.1 putative ABC transporter ATP-binding protein [Calycomorphotria hydatis]
MGQNYIFTIESLTKMHDDKEVLSNIWLAFYPGAKIGVLGKNGAGKSTLLRIMAGEDKEYMGTATPAKGIKTGFFHQEPRLDPKQTVAEAIGEAVSESQAVLDKFNDLNMKLAEELSPEEMESTLAELEEVQNKIDHANLWELDRTVDLAKDALRVPDDEALIENLSGGEKRRVAMARLLLDSPDLLLLDEPTNHLDAESVAWLERFLAEFKGTVVAVTHDRYFLDNVAGWILELDRGKGFPFEGNYTSWLEQKAARMAVEERKETKRQKTLKSELEWVRSSPKARETKNRARLQRYEELAAQDYDAREDAADIQIAPGPPLGDLVVDAENVTKAFGDKLLYEDLNFRLPRGGIVGVIGPNGAGKTTLFKMIMGQEEPDSGTLKVGETVQLAYVDQSRDALDPDKTVYEEISGGLEHLEIGKSRIHARAYCNRFNFKGADQQVKVGQLSGGERNRVHLAKLLRRGGNLILLDEPTNDLDVDTLRVLEEALVNFGGCVMVSSHDRWFLDRIATHILAFEGDSQVYWHEGNFDSYERNRHERLGSDADQPHRIRYRRFNPT